MRYTPNANASSYCYVLRLNCQDKHLRTSVYCSTEKHWHEASPLIQLFLVAIRDQNLSLHIWTRGQSNNKRNNKLKENKSEPKHKHKSTQGKLSKLKCQVAVCVATVTVWSYKSESNSFQKGKIVSVQIGGGLVAKTTNTVSCGEAKNLENSKRSKKKQQRNNCDQLKMKDMNR